MVVKIKELAAQMLGENGAPNMGELMRMMKEEQVARAAMTAAMAAGVKGSKGDPGIAGHAAITDAYAREDLAQNHINYLLARNKELEVEVATMRTQLGTVADELQAALTRITTLEANPGSSIDIAQRLQALEQRLADLPETPASW